MIAQHVHTTLFAAAITPCPALQRAICFIFTAQQACIVVRQKVSASTACTGGTARTARTASMAAMHHAACAAATTALTAIPASATVTAVACSAAG